MLIKLLSGMAGDGFSYSPGEVVEFEDEEAQRIVDAGFAVAADDQPASKRGRKGKADVVSSEGDASAND